MSSFRLVIEETDLALLRNSGIQKYLCDGAKSCNESKYKNIERECCCLLIAATYYLNQVLKEFDTGIAKQMHDRMMYARIYLNDDKDFPIIPLETIAIDSIKKKIAKLSQESGRKEIDIFETINSQIINIIIYMKWIKVN